MLTDLANVCRSSGLTVIEVQGWQSRGYAGQSLAAVNGVLWHHTATASVRNYTSGAPTLGMLRDGRSDLPGPLCNLSLGRGGEVYVVAAGVANHAGQGSAPGFPTDMGNHYLIGIEMESSGVAPWDWTPAQLAAAPRLGAALERAYLQWLAPDMRLQLAHYEYSSAGKIDPAGWPGGMDGLRASINAILAGPQAAVGPASNPTVTPIQEDDMGIYDDLTRYDQFGKPDGKKTSVATEAQWASANFARLSGQVSGLLEAVKQLAKAQGKDLDIEAVKQAAKAGASEAIAGGVNVGVTVNGRAV